MKKLLVLAIALFPLFSYSQDTIRIPKHAAKQIVKDLVACEGTQNELKLCEEQIKLLEKKSTVKDSIITTYVSKSETYTSQIQYEKDKLQLQKDAYDDLKKEHKKLKIKLFFNQLGSGVIIATITYFLIIK